MYRKITFASLALNVAFVLWTLWIVLLLPQVTNIYKDQRTEMPLAFTWLDTAHHFVTNPQSIVPTLVILLVGFFMLKAFRKQASARN